MSILTLTPASTKNDSWHSSYVYTVTKSKNYAPQ